ncbi:MAG: glycosyltransferase family 2 protein [Acidobacteria bacterium]|nr:glycosyltransferase family 2 protein [Acidobacteriota bacterium]MBS1865007.1 glycosyltransferase family 2 protein [Acidobacteriota bacterium]
MKIDPLVSVLTPVRNGQPYLAQCIESVLSQSYSNFEYIIVDNCSTDDTLQVAQKYAQQDERIKVVSNESLLDIIANHNKAFGLISPEAQYCKIVSADDWLFPDCIEKLVSVAQSQPSVGLVNSYQLSGGSDDWRNWQIKWAEIPYPSTTLPGKEVARNFLLGGPYVFGTPTSILYRADLVRKESSFYPNASPEADTSACIKQLAVSDFGFVHQVLSFERIHSHQQTTASKKLHAYSLAKLRDLKAYGHLFLTQREHASREAELLHDYYAVLATSAVNFRERSFWSHHSQRLREIGYRFDTLRLGFSVAAKLADLCLNPKQTVEKIVRRHNNGKLSVDNQSKRAL